MGMHFFPFPFLQILTNARLWYEHCCASSSENSVIQKFVEFLVELARKFSRSRSSWMEFKKIQLEMLYRTDEFSDDEGEADFDGDEGLACDAKSKPQVKKVLRLLTPVLIRLNSMYYLIHKSASSEEPVN